MSNSGIIVLTAIISFASTAVLGKILIPLLKKLKYGQTILDIGPRWHKSKEGTPTMGGVMFGIGIVIAVLVSFITLVLSGSETTAVLQTSDNVRLLMGVLMAVSFGLLGFADDYIKVVKKQNLGLTAIQKLIFQFLIAAVYMLTLFFFGESTIVDFPFIGQINFGLLYYPLMIVFIVFFVNSVNLTDGIDGLASTVTFVVAIAFMIASTILSNIHMNILATALAGGCMGFLMWNFYPAKVFMGDTGSMFLGGLVVALGFGLKIPAFLLLMGILYILEALSVVLQVIFFKLTHKRIFKMSPIHHHFEMSGYSEIKIVVLFSLVTFIGCAIGIFALILV